MSDAAASPSASYRAASGASAVIETLALGKVYSPGTEAEVIALRDVDLRIGGGEFVAIMGPSGSGKSTLMNLLGCLDTPSAGTYRCDGVDVATLDAEERARLRLTRIGFVFQGFNLLSRMDALENVAMPLAYTAMPREERLRRAHAALAAVGLAARERHRPSELSGGQQQRVAIARALVGEPALVLADEPTGNLDSRTSMEVMALFQELNAQGITIVLVTHEHDVAQYATRIIEVRDGRIRRDEPVADRRSALRDLEAA